ncbi:MAG: hypothetical protein ACM3UO_00315 [Bacillota bacterium]
MTELNPNPEPTSSDVAAMTPDPAPVAPETPTPETAPDAPVATEPSVAEPGASGVTSPAPETTPAPAAPADPSVAEPASTDSSEPVSSDPSAPVQPTEPVLQGGPTDPTVDANGEPLPQAEPQAPVDVSSLDPQETVQVALDEDGTDGAFIHGNLVVGLNPTDVLAGDVEAVLAAADAAGRKVKVVIEN